MTQIKPWERKRPASERAVDEYVRDGMTVGLGTGNAANFAVLRMGQLVKEGYRFRCVATSERTEALAREQGLEIISLDEAGTIDVTIDGADEVAPDLSLIKGLGGALWREKMVAGATDKEIIVVDDIKLVDTLGVKTALPVEVCIFGHMRTAEHLGALGCAPVLRMDGESPYVTDGGNYIYDCKFGSIPDPVALQSEIDTMPGVVECGLFVGMTHAVFVFHEDGTITEMRSGRNHSF